jgi:hypothetical protein
LLIPSDFANAQYVINSAVGTPWKVMILQQGDLILNEPLIVGSDVKWSGRWGISNSGAPSFSSTGTPTVYCYAYPCVHVGNMGNAQAVGADTIDELTFTSPTQNGLELLIDAGWGMSFYRDVFISGNTDLDMAGIDVLIRPGGAEYKFIEDNFGGGPGQVIDQSWTPLFYAAAGDGRNVAGGVGTITIRDSMWNRRGFYQIANGGSGIWLEIDHAYRQGGITPFFAVQSINGYIDGGISITFANHDTESQAAYAWFCNLSCTPGGGPPFYLGFANAVSVDGSKRPLQITGGGNSAINPLSSPISPLRSR